MLELIIKKVSNKIIIPLFALMLISGLAVTYSTTSKVSENSIAKTKENLEMLNSAMFQSLRNAMNTGDPTQIAKAEEEARNIKGVSNLTVAKSKELLELFPSENSKFTTNKDILKSFDTKESQILEIKEKGNHSLRMIKPMIATAECIACHANQKEGDVIGIMDLTFSLNEADKEIVSLTIEILLVSTILTLITIGLIYWIVKKATNPINKLKEGFENLLKSNDPNIDLSIESKDELGEVATLFNQYMHKMREGLKQDAIVIEEVNDVLEKTKNGFYVYQVGSNASNVHVEDLKNKLNSMILTTKNTLDKINDTLRLYAESKFDAKMDDSGIYGNLASLTSGIKLVGNNTSEVLAMVMNTGNSLNENTNILSNASRNLSISSNQQASSLEETAAALEEITSTIQSNTQSTYKMSQLAQNLTSSAQNGLELANRTAVSMDDINKQVSSINEAIEVIDQIAFQTNILSLNAAVEAATAGEAGKGFAVVAQEVRNLASRSAEAAKEIKNIVEQAANKANQGKAISDNMIHGYRELNSNISNTIQIINEVAVASKEQEKGIVQINDAINMLDQATQKNAQVAEEISDMSQNIAQMSNSLVTTASRASFLKEAISMVSDIDLVYDTAQLKVDILNSKDKVFSNLGKYEKFTVSKEANVENWINQYTQKHGDNKTLLENIKQLNDSLNNNLQNLVDTNASKPKNEMLNEKAKELETNTIKIFEALNSIKIK